MEKILIRKDDYLELRRQAQWMKALEAAGVDNWEGMEYAIELHREMFPREGE